MFCSRNPVSCICVSTMAIVLLYPHFTVQRTYQKSVWIFMALLLHIIWLYFPIHEAWALAGVPSGLYVNIDPLIFISPGLGILEDATIYVLPIKILYELQVPQRQKIPPMIIFVVGGLVVITGMVKIYFLESRAEHSRSFS